MAAETCWPLKKVQTISHGKEAIRSRYGGKSRKVYHISEKIKAYSVEYFRC